MFAVHPLVQYVWTLRRFARTKGKSSF